MLIRRVIDDQIHHHMHAALLGAVREFHEIAERTETRVHGIIVGDVVPVVPARRDLKRHQPNGRDPEPLQVVEAAHQPGEIADAVAIGIHERADRQAIDDGVLVPEIVDHSRVPGGGGGVPVANESAGISLPPRSGGGSVRLLGAFRSAMDVDVPAARFFQDADGARFEVRVGAAHPQ